MSGTGPEAAARVTTRAPHAQGHGMSADFDREGEGA
ncbi:hypothetical protein NONO_c45230 [Nocardia nova SH22a]|uniref:Uncharacterized protein n=1 Tax=Nocardia nova SH22a TaxID=1415166 RepID=W5TJ89_9NOCA|nr:hypothetical protein NONO_c45230 [Nocardia nova SH22a]